MDSRFKVTQKQQPHSFFYFPRNLKWQCGRHECCAFTRSVSVVSALKTGLEMRVFSVSVFIKMKKEREKREKWQMDLYEYFRFISSSIHSCACGAYSAWGQLVTWQCCVFIGLCQVVFVITTTLWVFYSGVPTDNRQKRYLWSAIMFECVVNV